MDEEEFWDIVILITIVLSPAFAGLFIDED
jgi:hypothetical protein